MIVLGEAGRSYRASHEERIPSDRTMFLELSEPDEWSAFGHTAAELFQEVFSRQAVRRTREIVRLQAALVSCDPGDTFGSLRTDVLSVELLIELAGVAPGANMARTIRPDTRERVVRTRGYLDEHLSDSARLRGRWRSVRSTWPAPSARRWASLHTDTWFVVDSTERGTGRSLGCGLAPRSRPSATP